MSEKPETATDKLAAGPLVPKKSFRAAHVTVGIRLKAGGWHSDSARIEGSTELTTDQARALAASLIELADKADAKVAAKAAAEERRRKWRDREVAAGRMKIVRLGALA